MRLRFSPVPSLPLLAWCADISAATTTGDVGVVHGTAVETSDDWFVEGAWDGPYGEHDLAGYFMAGSGGAARPHSVTFFGPSHNLEYLVVYEREGVRCVSNSLAFALATAGDALNPTYPFYQNRFSAILHGPHHRVVSVPTQRGVLTLVSQSDVHVGGDGRLDFVAKTSGREFTSFEDYRGFLSQAIGAILANASDGGRGQVYRPVAAVSSGYDSVAAAALATEAGCREALTMRRVGRNGELVDHGGPAANALGLAVAEADRLDYSRREGLPEAEFYACGFLAQETVMLGWEDHLPGRILVTGFHGDAIWGDTPRPGLSAGGSLGEFRRRVGFLQVPVPFIGEAGAPSLRRLSRSQDMEPWSLGGPYDRPIARRLAEDAGVPREAFGMVKRGYVAKFALPWRAQPTRRSGGELSLDLSAASASDFRGWRKRRWVITHQAVELVGGPLRRLDRLADGSPRPLLRTVGKKAVQLAAGVLLRSSPEEVLNRRYDESSLLPLWGVERISYRYRNTDPIEP